MIIELNFEKISKTDVYKGKRNFLLKSTIPLIKIKQDSLPDSENISDSDCLFMRVYMICLEFPSPSQLTVLG